MEQKQADQLLMLHSPKLLPEYISTIRERLVDMDYTQAAIVFNDLKDPTTALIISVVIGTFGIDRFYIGDYAIGAGKLAITLLVPVITCGTVFFAGSIWWIIDLFLIGNATRKKNSEKIMQALAVLPY